MTAKEAKKIADTQNNSREDVQYKDVMKEIERAAKDGKYTISYTGLKDNVVKLLRADKFILTSKAGKYNPRDSRGSEAYHIISWS